MKYAFVRNGVVESIEGRVRDGMTYPIEQLYHKDILPLFVQIPPEYEERCWQGWRHDADTGQWTEPVAGEVDPQTGRMYVPRGMTAEGLQMILQNARDITGALLGQVETNQEQTGILLPE